MAEEKGAVGMVNNCEGIASVENTTFKCEACLFDNVEEDARAFCTDCPDYLCTSCAREHRKNKLSRNHIVVKGEDISGDLSTIAAMKRMINCSDHPELAVTHKCGDHDKYICVTCLAKFHCECKNLIEIAKANNAHVKEEIITRVKETLSKLQVDATASKEASEMNITTYRDQLASVQSEQQILFNSISEKLSKAKADIESETYTLVMQEIEYNEQNVRKCKKADADEEELRMIFEFVMKYGKSAEMIVIPDLIVRKAKHLDETIQLECQKSLCFETTFDADTVTNFAKVSMVSTVQDEIASDNDICISSDEILQSDTQVLQDDSDTSSKRNLSKIDSTTQTDELLLQTDHSNTIGGANSQNLPKRMENTSLMSRNISQFGISYKIRCTDDKVLCNIYAIEILPDKRIILIDSTNKRLKILKEDFSVHYTKHFNEHPLDMCHINDQTIAVSFGKSVETYEIGPYFACRIGQFLTNFRLLAIDKVGNDGEIAVLFKENKTPFIQIGDAITGHLFKTVSFEGLFGVPFMLEGNERIRLLCRSTNEVFVSDKEKLCCFKNSSNIDDREYSDTSMKKSWLFKSRMGSFVKEIKDIAADDEGNVYVCGHSSCNVHQISRDNYQSNRIIISNIQNPLSLGVDSKRGYVMIGCKDDDCLHVYNFF